MSSDVSQQSTQQELHATHSTYDEEKMSSNMRWFALGVLSAGYLASIITGIIGFSLTRDTHFLVFLSPTLFTPAIFYLVGPAPLDNKRFELKKLQIEANIRLKAEKQRRQSSKS